MAHKEFTYQLFRFYLVVSLAFVSTTSLAQQCFTPAYPSSKYFSFFLDALIENNKDFGWEDYYICAPSFDTTYALTIEKEQLICKKIVDLERNDGM